MRISDWMSAIEDDSVPLREKEIIASDRIREVTMTKLHAEQEKNHTMRKGVRKGTALVIAAAALLALTVTAFATGLVGGLVNWQGEIVSETENEPAPTPYPTNEMARDEELEDRVQSVLSSQKEGEVIVFRYGERAESQARVESVSSPEELSRRLEKEGSELSIPFELPAGFAFTGGWITLESAEGYGYTPEKTETLGGDALAEFYTAVPGGDFVGSYLLTYQNEAGENVQILANLEENTDHNDFGLQEGESAESIDLPGMENALLFQGGDRSKLYMRKRLETPISYVTVFSLMSEGHGEIEEYTEIIYSIHAPVDILSADTLRELIAD